MLRIWYYLSSGNFVEKEQGGVSVFSFLKSKCGAELRQIYGLGDKKIHEFGEELVRLVRGEVFSTS